MSTDPWKPYIDAARAAGEAEAWVPDYASDSLWMRVEVPPLEPEPEAEKEATYDRYGPFICEVPCPPVPEPEPEAEL